MILKCNACGNQSMKIERVYIPTGGFDVDRVSDTTIRLHCKTCNASYLYNSREFVNWMVENNKITMNDIDAMMALIAAVHKSPVLMDTISEKLFQEQARQVTNREDGNGYKV